MFKGVFVYRDQGRNICFLLAPKVLLDYLRPMITIPSHPTQRQTRQKKDKKDKTGKKDKKTRGEVGGGGVDGHLKCFSCFFMSGVYSSQIIFFTI